MLEIMNSRDNLAFTLAEVLITLGIIGVVAAITIPTLIAKTHSKQYTTSFKKSLSTLSNAARMSEAQFGLQELIPCVMQILARIILKQNKLLVHY